MKGLGAWIVCVGVLYLLDAYFFNGMYFGALYQVLTDLIHIV